MSKNIFANYFTKNERHFFTRRERKEVEISQNYKSFEQFSYSDNFST